jgi:uncharacterized protein with beta-barrel porin domain
MSEFPVRPVGSRAPRRFALAIVATLLIGIAVVLISEPALADCTPASASNITATCTGTTTNQAGGAPGSSGDPSGIGYGTGAETGITVNLTGGTITGTSLGIGIDSGTVTSATGTSITGGDAGISAITGTLTVTNSGSIVGTSQEGIFAQTGATVTNNAGASITGNAGILVNAGAVTVTNSGSIAGTGGNGISATTSATVTNNAGASISGSLGIVANGTVTVTNSGSIVSGGFAGIDSFGGNVILTNNAGAVVSGGSFGVIAGGGGGGTSVVNAGTISGGSRAIQFTGIGNTVTNNAGGILTGGALAIWSLGSGTKVFNAGTISGPTAIEFVGGNNELTNNAGGTIKGTTAVEFESAGNKLTNNAGGSITGTQFGIVALTGGSNVFNAGTISGATAAIQFGGTGNTLTLAAGSVITGNVLGTGSDTFQLGSSGAATFDVSQLGAAAQYRGFGTFNKIDSSTWTLTGTSTFTGPVNVNGGTLSVNGDISSAASLTVNAGGILGGNGVVGNTTINGGTLSPGNSIGLLTVNGNLAFTAASTYMVEVSPTTADRTNVTGKATLGNATVNAVPTSGTLNNQRYTILNATGGVVGTFNPTVTTALPDLHGSLSYDANNAYLNFALNFGSGLNANQQNVANALTGFFNGGGGLPVAFANLTPAGLTQISGETATGVQQTTFNAMGEFVNLLTDPFMGRGNGVSGGTSPAGFAEESSSNAYAARRTTDAFAMFTKAPPAAPFLQRWSVWAAGYGGSQSTSGDAIVGSNNTTSRIAGTAVGADYLISPNTLAGFALAGAGTSFAVNGQGYGRSDLFQAGAYVRHTEGAAYITAALAYGWQDVTTDRNVTVAGLDHLSASFNANAWSGRVEGGYRFVAPVIGGVGITPYAAGQFTTFDLPAYAEQAVAGTPAFALAYAAKSVTDTRSEFGIRSDESFVMANGVLVLRSRFAWAHDYNPDRSIGATFQTLPGASFVVNGAAQASDSALTTASVEWKWLSGWSAAATFEGEFSNVTQSYAGKAAVRYAW